LADPVPPQAPAQEPAPPAQPAGPLLLQRDDVLGERYLLLAGKSMVIQTNYDIERIHLTNPAVADGLVVSPREVVVLGKAAGTISLIIWAQGGRRVHHELVVDAGVPTLQQDLQKLFPGENIQVSITEGALVLSGQVSNNVTMLRAAEVATASAGDRAVVNMLQLPGGAGSQQVMLQVRFAEVNRRAIRELGASFFATRPGFTARATTQQFTAPDFDDVNSEIGGLVFGDYLNLFFFQREEGIGGLVRALEQGGWFQSLAEPNLIAYNGVEASFLAGGEFPYPVVSGSTGNVSVQFKEFGVRLTFLPRIAGDTVRLSVRPEVSSLDFANGLTLGGFRIPALTTRYAQTEVELRDGQSFAIAGLLNSTSQEDRAWIPILSRIPIIGNLFKSKANREDETELMVLITPRLVRPLDPDEVPPLPAIVEPAAPSGPSGGAGGNAPAPTPAPPVPGPGAALLGGGGVVDAPGLRPPGGS
jgi:pilus assembly protein CpaC